MADAASGEVDALQAQLEEAQQAQHAAEEALAELQVGRAVQHCCLHVVQCSTLLV